MKKQLIAALAATFTSLTLTSCSAGPHQLRRSVDDWDQKLYVNSPWLDGVLWFIPVIPFATFVAYVGDFFVTDAYSFWFHDAWDGKGTGYEHFKVDAPDGKMGSLLSEGSGWLKVAK
jgi:hypothetical protein